jgi:hypothetical protein
MLKVAHNKTPFPLHTLPASELRDGLLFWPFTGWRYFFEQFNGSPRSFLGFCYGGNRIAGVQRRRMRRGQDIPQRKSLENKGLKCGSERNVPYLGTVTTLYQRLYSVMDYKK